MWRSILAGQSVLREGIARRVGNGRDTHVWGSPCLANSGDPFLHTDCPDHLRDARVCNLLDESGTWDEELLHDLFVESDVIRILRALLLLLLCRMFGTGEAT